MLSMEIHDQKIINLIDELLLEKNIQKIEIKMHELFDLVAVSSTPVDIEKLKALKDLKASFENMEKNNSKPFLSALNSLKNLY